MPKPVLPKVLKLKLSRDDRDDLACGMPTKCIISRAAWRKYPEITYRVSVCPHVGQGLIAVRNSNENPQAPLRRAGRGHHPLHHGAMQT